MATIQLTNSHFVETTRDQWIDQSKDQKVRIILGKIWDTICHCEHGSKYIVYSDHKNIKIVSEDSSEVIHTIELSHKTSDIWSKQFHKNVLKLSFKESDFDKSSVCLDKPHDRNFLSQFIQFIYVWCVIKPALQAKLHELGMSPKEAYIHKREWIDIFSKELRLQHPHLEKWFQASLKQTITSSLKDKLHYEGNLSSLQIRLFEHHHNQKHLLEAIGRSDFSDVNHEMKNIQWSFITLQEWKNILLAVSNSPPKNQNIFYEAIANALSDEIITNERKNQTRHLKNLVKETFAFSTETTSRESLVLILKQNKTLCQIQDSHEKSYDLSLPLEQHLLMSQVVDIWCFENTQGHLQSSQKAIESLLTEENLDECQKNIFHKLNQISLQLDPEIKFQIRRAIKADKTLSASQQQKLDSALNNSSEISSLDKEQLSEVIKRSSFKKDQKESLIQIICYSLDTSELESHLKSHFKEIFTSMVLDHLRSHNLCSREMAKRVQLLVCDTEPLDEDINLIMENIQTLQNIKNEEAPAEDSFQMLSQQERLLKIRLKDLSKKCAQDPKQILKLGDRLFEAEETDEGLSPSDKSFFIASTLKFLLEDIEKASEAEKSELLWKLEYLKDQLGTAFSNPSLLVELEMLEEIYPEEYLQKPLYPSCDNYAFLLYRSKKPESPLKDIVDSKTLKVLEVISLSLNEIKNFSTLLPHTKEKLRPLLKQALGNSEINKEVSKLYYVADFKENLVQNIENSSLRSLISFFSPKRASPNNLPETISYEAILILRVLSHKISPARLDEIDGILNRAERALTKASLREDISSNDQISLQELAILNSFDRLDSSLENGLFSLSPIDFLLATLGEADPLIQQLSTLALRSQSCLQQIKVYSDNALKDYYRPGSLLAESCRKKEAYTGRALSGEERFIYYFLSALRRDGYLHGAKMYKHQDTLCVSHVLGSLSQERLELELLLQSDVWEMNPLELLPSWAKAIFEKNMSVDWQKILLKEYEQTENELHVFYDQLGKEVTNNSDKRLHAGLASYGFLGKSHHRKEKQNLAQINNWTEQESSIDMICSEFASRATLDALIRFDKKLYLHLLQALRIDISQDLKNLEHQKLPAFMTRDVLYALYRGSNIAHFKSLSKTSKEALEDPSQEALWFDPNVQKELGSLLKKLGYESKSLVISKALITKNVLNLPYDEKEDFNYIHPNRMVDLLISSHCIKRKALPKELLKILAVPESLV